jgi:hypothetical protein
MVLDEGGKRTPAITYTLIGTYRISGFVIDNRDPIQMGPFFEIANNYEFWNIFSKSQTMPILIKTGQATEYSIFLNKQFRIFTPILISYINHTFYYSQMVDTVKDIPLSANVDFFKGLFSKKLGISHNFIVLVIKDSKSLIESGSSSIYNLSTQYYMIELIKEAKRMLASDKYKANKNMTFAAISPYKAEATIIQTEINHTGLKNCNSLVSEVVQGIGRNGVFLTLLNAQRLTEFGTEPR